MRLAKDRPAIREADKRKIRQRCGFGCVICGLPLYEYEHIIEWSKVKTHNPEHITLLCPTHHAEKTRGLLPRATVEAANAAPFNRRSNASRAFPLRYSGSNIDVRIGGGKWRQEFAENQRTPLLIIKGFPVFQVKRQDGHLLISLSLYSKTGRPLLKITDNELTVFTNQWDIEFVGRVLKIRNAPREIVAQIEFCVPDELHLTRGVFSFGGRQVEIEPDHVYIPEYDIRMAGYSARMNGGAALKFD
jgi:trigger factor